jgi:glycosyl transferase family 4
MVLTIHDVSLAVHPEWFSMSEGTRRRLFTWLSARRATRVLTVSNFSKSEIVARLGVADAKVDVIYSGLTPLRPPDAVGTVLRSRFCAGRWVDLQPTSRPLGSGLVSADRGDHSRPHDREAGAQAPDASIPGTMIPSFQRTSTSRKSRRSPYSGLDSERRGTILQHNPIMQRHLLMLVPLVALLGESPASAQVFGSIGIGATSDDAIDRFPITYRTPAASRNTLIEAGVFVSARVGVAAELLKAPDLSARTTGLFGIFEAVETERALTVTVRIEAVHWQAATLELLGGGGGVFASAQTTATDRSTGTSVVRNDSQAARALVGGVDVPLRIVPHVYGVGTFRVYQFERDPMPIVAYDRQVGPSTRMIFGALARVAW